MLLDAGHSSCLRSHVQTNIPSLGGQEAKLTVRPKLVHLAIECKQEAKYCMYVRYAPVQGKLEDMYSTDCTYSLQVQPGEDT